MEGIREKALEDFLRQTIKGTEWEGKVFIAGGYVRDEFMGKDPKDLDIMVNAPNGGFRFAKWITQKVGCYKGPQVDPPIPPKPDFNVDAKGKPATPQDQAIEDQWMSQLTAIQKLYTNPVIFPRFGTSKFNLRGVNHMGIDLSEMDIEAVMPRKEQYTAGSRKPEVSQGELKDDVERRDFTVNSLLKDLSSGEILDLTGLGKADIKAGIVRTPLSPDKIFSDDPLRMLRAVRFAMKYNWKLPMFMLRGLKKNAVQLKNISQERIRDELDKMLMTGSPDRAIKLMKVVGLLQFVIPEFKAAVKMTQNKHHTQDVFHHTLDVLKNTQPVLLQRLMALFHDIGKTVTRSVTPTGVHFYGHEDAGARMVEEIMRRLKYPEELVQAVKLGVKNHMRLKQAGDTGVNLSDKALRKFKIEVGDHLENILNLMHADNVAHSEASSMPNQITNIKKRLEALKMDVSKGKPKLPITGLDLQKLGLTPGPVYSKIMTAVTDAWFENPNVSAEEALEIAKKIAGV
jgi:putative nucleotidyltransferase with HDIG domain